MTFIILLLLPLVVHGSIGYTNSINIGPYNVVVGYGASNYANVSDVFYDRVFDIPPNSDSNDTFKLIQGAVTWVGVSGGGTVFLLEGTYKVIRNIFIYDGKTHFHGAGMNLTKIVLDDYAPSFIVGTQKKSGFVRSSQTDSIIISNMTLDGNRENQYHDANSTYGRYGVFTEACTNVWFDNLRVTNFQGYGFDPHGLKVSQQWGENLTITNCISDNNEWDGYTIDQTYYTHIENCLSTNNGRHGFNIVTASVYLNLKNNSARGNGNFGKYGNGCGIMVQKNKVLQDDDSTGILITTHDIVVSNNLVEDNNKSGICLNDVFNITITENKIIDMDYCFNIILTQSSVITENTCISPNLLTSKNATIVYGKGTEPDVYVYNNIFDHSEVSHSVMLDIGYIKLLLLLELLCYVLL